METIQVKLDKSKVLVMRSGGRLKNDDHEFQYRNGQIETVAQYKYLGLILNSQGLFTQAKQNLKQKALKAILSVWPSICPNKVPPLGVTNQIFNAMIKPIILYNHEIWATDLPASLQKAIMADKNVTNEQYIKFINNSPAEQLHSKYNRMVLGVKKNTPTIAVRAELGKYPLYIDSFIAIIKYWLRLCNMAKDRLVVDALECNYHIQQQGLFTWTSVVQYFLKTSGFDYIWEQKCTANVANFLRELTTKLKTN